MATRLYPVFLEWDDVIQGWTLLSPDFPEIASFVRPREDVHQVASATIEAAIYARRQVGDKIPDPTPGVWLPHQNWQPPIRNVLVHVAVTVGPMPIPICINVSLDKQLLERIDAEATLRGMSRSGFLAEGARALLQD